MTMSAPATTKSTAELVPLADRLRYLQAFRVAVLAAVAAVTLGFPGSLVVDRLDVFAVSAGYVGLAALGQLVWRLSERVGVLLFGALLMADGLYLGWTSYATGGFASPIRYLILLHLITVALLASYRTGLKLALWHSLLLLVVHYAQQADLLVRAPDTVGVGTPFQQLLAFSAVFWFVALITATFSAVNERELRRRRYDLEALARMAARLDDASDPREVADVVADAVSDTFDFRRAVVLVAPDGEELSLAAHRGAEEVAHGAAPGASSAITETLSTRRTHFVSRLDPAADSWLDAMLPDARNLILLPLASGERAVGVLAVENALGGGARIQRRVVSMVERFTSHGTLSLRNAWLLEDAHRRAATDGLTGLANRRTFDAVLDQELERAARGGDEVSLVLVDVDHFKRVNDDHGHQAGDDVLRRVAGVFASSCRAYDTAARYGGEEMAVILPRTSSQDGVMIAERLRLAIEALPDHPRVTVSAGVATYPLGATDAAALIAAADRALYASKASGRNRVSLTGEAHALAA